MTEDDELLAAELAFGLVAGAEARAAEARVATDPGFAAAHARWVGHAATLVSGGGEAPRPSLWPAIVARLPANDSAPAHPDRALRWWQGGTAVAAAAAIVFGVMALQRPPLPAPIAPAPPPAAAAVAAPLVAVLGSETGDAVVTISFDRASGRLTAAPRGLELGRKVPELWVIPVGGKPRSLGVIAAGAPGWTRAPAPAAPEIAAGATLAISVEPAGGSPSGQPTGPVIVSGTLAAT